jgi:site-specific DNA-cytosine methylase
MKLLDLFAGRLGWSKAFLDRGWDVVAIDLTLPSIPIPDRVEYRLVDVLTITPDWVREQGFDFICASSPCEQFSVHGMKHFHPKATA